MSAKFYDTLVGEYIKNPGLRLLSLDKISYKDFSYKMISFDEITDKKKLSFDEVEINGASIYSAEDVYITNKLYEKQKEEKIPENKILNEIEVPLIEVIKDMEINGVYIDTDRLKGIGILLKKEIESLEKDIINEVGVEFNINSPKQVGEILYEKLNLPKGKKTKTGYSVNAEVLGDLAKKYPIAQKIVDYRHYIKINSTYVDGLIDLVDENSIVHTNYNQTVTTTGRLSSTNPNLQNIPQSNKIAGEIRDAFISRFENGKILAIDYSQVEVRLLAIMSEDENLLNAFKQNVDIHEKTAELIGTSQRKIAKGVNFGVIYGISGFGLAKMINIPVAEANEYIKRFFESYPKVKIYLENIIKSCEEKKYVETLFGRRRYINSINDLNKIIKKAAEREAINMPIQGTSADIIKIAMIKIDNFLKQKKLKSKMIMQVHDELVFDIYPGEGEIVKKEAKNIMENILTGKEISLKCDAIDANSWKYTK